MLVEREALLGELGRLAHEGFAGQGRLAFVGGEAGVGKTALASELARELAAVATVRQGGADNLTTAEPLSAFADAFPELQPVMSAGGDRFRLYRSIRHLLGAGPVLLVLEDLHWADEATLDAVRFLGRRLAGLPVLVVATYRDDEVGPRHPLTLVLGALAGLPGMHRLRVPPLSVAGVGTLVQHAGAGLDATAVHARTGGNAFFVTEVLAAGTDDLPGSVRDAVLARIARLPGEAAEVVAAAAILGTPSPVGLLTAVSGRGVAAVDECTQAGILVGDDDLGFRHDLARQAVERSLSAAHRRRLHGAALGVLTERRPTDHRALAHHALGAGEDALAVEHATAAGDIAARLGAHREAVQQYQVALRASAEGPSRPAQGARLYEALSYECYLTDRLPEALAARQRALESYELDGDLAGVGATQRWLSRLAWFLARNDEAERYAARAVATLEPLGDGHELAMAYSNMAQLRMLASDTPGARLWGERALDLARRLDDREVQVHALNNLGTAIATSDGWDAGVAQLERSLDLALAMDAHEHVARAYTNLVSLSVQQHRHPDAVRFRTAGVRYCEERDLDAWARYMEAWHAVAMAETGEWDDALVLASRLLGHPDLSPVSAIPAATTIARVLARRGEDGTAELTLASSLAAATGEIQRLAPAACAAAEVAWLSDRTREIPALTAEALGVALAHRDPWVLGELLWWRTLADVTRPDGGTPGPVAEPFALMVAGRWTEAGAAWEAIGSPVWAAHCLGLDDDVAAAQRAIAALDELGASASVDAVLRTRRAHGLALPRRPRSATRANLAQLTGRELDVLSHLEAGLSTTDIAGALVLSPRTVEHHVSAILRKLGEPTRARAVATARRLGVLSS